MKYNLKGSGHVGLVLGKVTGKAVAPATGNGSTTIATTNLNSNTSEADVVQQTNPIAENGHELSKERKSIRLLCINSKTWLRIEAGILITIVLVVWILLTLPIIFFYLPVESRLTLTANMTDDTSNGDLCKSTVPYYNGSTCQIELQSLQACLPVSGPTSSGMIHVQRDQTEAVGPLLDILKAFASDDCKAAALPFLCVYFFGLCDSTGKAHRPSSSQCTEISTGVCATEWALASNFPNVILPDCATFPDKTILMASCGNNSSSTEHSSTLESATESLETPRDLTTQQGTQELDQQPLNCTILCSKSFHCQEDDNEFVCTPTCSKFKENSEATTFIIDIFVVMFAVFGVLCAIAVLVIAGIRWKEMFVFPTSIIVYEVITYLFLAIVTLITYTDRAALYCGSQNLLESVENPTIYCTISGIIFYYTLSQLAMWWILHVSVVFWKLNFPFHAHFFDKTKYLHAFCVILALLIPLAPIIAAITKSRIDSNRAGTETTSIGFGLTRFPPLLCTGTDKDVTFYSLILPLDLILFVGFPLLVMIFWIMHKNHINKHNKGSRIGTAKKKILIVFCYYVIFSVFSLSSFTIATRNTHTNYSVVANYFLCERNGYDPNRPCDRSELEGLSQPEVAALSFFLLAVFPTANLIFAVNFHQAMKKVNSCHKSLRTCS